MRLQGWSTSRRIWAMLDELKASPFTNVAKLARDFGTTRNLFYAHVNRCPKMRVTWEEIKERRGSNPQLMRTPWGRRIQSGIQR